MRPCAEFPVAFSNHIAKCQRQQFFKPAQCTTILVSSPQSSLPEAWYIICSVLVINFLNVAFINSKRPGPTALPLCRQRDLVGDERPKVQYSLFIGSRRI